MFLRGALGFPSSPCGFGEGGNDGDNAHAADDKDGDADDGG